MLSNLDQGTEIYTDLPEAISRSPEHEGLQAMPTEMYSKSVARASYSKEEEQQQQPEMPHSTPQDSRICGMRKKLFFTLIVIAVVAIIAAAIGGGIAGSRQKDSSTSESTPTSTATASLTSSTPSATLAASSSSTSDTPSLTTTSVPGPSGLTLQRDCPSANETLYSFGDGSSPLLFRRFCSICPVNQNGFSADIVIFQPTTSRDDCIQQCALYDIQNRSNITSGVSKVCSAVCWRYNITDSQFGYCLGYETRNLSGTFAFNPPENSDSAVWINESF